jgi:hypothetical protein
MSSSLNERFGRFRRRSRSIWELSFGGLEPHAEFTEPFVEFRRLLFWAMVVDDWTEASIRASDPQVDSTLGLREGEITVEAIGDRGLPVQFNERVGSRSGLWNDDVSFVDTSAQDVCLIDLFDWDEVGAMDHEYYLVKVAQTNTLESSLGRYGLVRPQNCHLQRGSLPARHGRL